MPVHDGRQPGRKRGRSMYPACSRASCRSTHHLSFSSIPPGCIPGIGSSRKGMYWDMGGIGCGRWTMLFASHYIILLERPPVHNTSVRRYYPVGICLFCTALWKRLSLFRQYVSTESRRLGGRPRYIQSILFPVLKVSAPVHIYNNCRWRSS